MAVYGIVYSFYAQKAIFLLSNFLFEKYFALLFLFLLNQNVCYEN